MTGEPSLQTLLWSALVGAIVVLGSRHELQQVRWGPVAWRVMMVLFVVVMIGAIVLVLFSQPTATPEAPDRVDPPAETTRV